MEVFPIPAARTGDGDPARTLRLLWSEPEAAPRHGPRQGLTIDQVVAAATALADAEGLDAVTMPLRSEEWGERAFQVRDPNGVIVELLDWNAATAG